MWFYIVLIKVVFIKHITYFIFAAFFFNCSSVRLVCWVLGVMWIVTYACGILKTYEVNTVFSEVSDLGATLKQINICKLFTPFMFSMEIINVSQGKITIYLSW